jgi:hypothetical protein
MEWLQVLMLFLANAGLIAMFRADSQKRLDEYRNESRESESRICRLIEAIQSEMKDFHTCLAVQDMEFRTRITNLETKKTKTKKDK